MNRRITTATPGHSAADHVTHEHETCGPVVPVRVVLADDAPLIRQGIALVLSGAQIDIAAQVTDAEALLLAVHEHQPDVVITDVRMPPTHTVEGLQAATAIQRAYPDIGVLLLSNHDETRYLTALLESARAGVGYLLKERVVHVDDFVAAVHAVAAGRTVLDPQIVSLLMGRSRSRQAVAGLTDRERAVLAAMATGASNAALARDLNLAPKTVEAHTSAIFLKLHLTETADEHRRVKAVLTFLRST